MSEQAPERLDETKPLPMPGADEVAALLSEVERLLNAEAERDALRFGLEDIRSRIDPHYGISKIKLHAIIRRLLGEAPGEWLDT